MDNFTNILAIIVGIGMIFALLFGIFYRKGEPMKAFVIYFSVFLTILLYAAYIICALYLIFMGGMRAF